MAKYKYVITQTPAGSEIYVDLLMSPAGHYLSRQPYLINLVKEVLQRSKFKGADITIEYDMGRVIGNTDIVETSEKDTIFYAQQNKASVFSRYAKNRNPAPSSQLTILLKKDDIGGYEVTNTWIGPFSPPFPGDELATEISREYWQTHALAFDNMAIQSKSITKDCPY